MKLIEKFKEQPFPVKMLAIIFLSWIYPFIESMIVGATGFYDLSIVAIILLSIGLLGFGYLALLTFFIPIGKWIGKLFK